MIRILGKEIYGLIVFAQAIIGYLVILINHGFDIIATKEISINRNDRMKLDEIVSSVLIIKFILLMISLLVFIPAIYFIPQARGYELLFYFSLWLCINEMLFPGWYFQGIEQMKFITYFNLLSRIVFIITMFIFIRSPKDYLFYPITNGLGAIIASSISLYIVFKKQNIKFSFQPLIRLKYYVRSSRPIFVSNLCSKVYYGSNRVILGSFLGMSEVAYYDLGEKIVQVLKIPQSILSQILFPKISFEKDLGFVKKIFKISLVFHLIIFLITIVFSKTLVQTLGGKQMISAFIVLDILALTIPIVAMSNIFGTQILIPFGHSRSYRNIILTSALFYIFSALILWLSAKISIISISLLTVVVEAYILFMFIVKFREFSYSN